MSCIMKVVTNEGYDRSTNYPAFAGFYKQMPQMSLTIV